MNDLENIIKIDFEDEDIVDTFDHVLAGIFNGDSSDSNKALNYVMKAVSLKEVKGPTKVLFYILQSLNDLGLVSVGKQSFNVDILSTILDNGLYPFIKKYSWDFEAWISKHSLEYDLDSVKGFREFEDFLFSEILRKYKEYCNMDTTQTTIYMQSLSSKLKELALGQALLYLGSVLTQGNKFGREYIQGSDNALPLMRKFEDYIEDRYSLETSEDARYSLTILEDLESAEEFRKQELTKREKRGFYETLYDCEFGTLDIQLMRGDIFAIIGDEGVGKTKLLIDQVYKALKSKHDVMLVCTETKKLVMLYMLYARHINETLGLEPSHVELLKFEEWIKSTEDSELRKNMEADYAECMSAIPSFHSEDMGKLTLIQSTRYEDFRSKVMTFCEKTNGDIVAMDSISFLDKNSGKYGGDDKSNIDELMKDMEYLSAELGVTFVFTTHTSSEANKALARGKGNTGVRVGAGSGHVTKLATLTILVSTTDELRVQDKFIFEAKKTRDRAVGATNQVIMLRNGNSNKYEFRKELQVSEELEDDLSEDLMY